MAKFCNTVAATTSFLMLIWVFFVFVPLLCSATDTHGTKIGIKSDVVAATVLNSEMVCTRFFASGLNYASCVRHIDRSVDKSYNTIALSFWLFVSDTAGVIGSNLIDVVRGVVCNGHNYPYVCLEVNS